nr:hypothetical protein [Viridibacillus sp. FSL H8-0123]
MEQLTCRDYLRKNDTAKIQYEQLKQELQN